MKHNFKKNLPFSLILLLCFFINNQPSVQSCSSVNEKISFEDVKLISQNTIVPFTLDVSNTVHNYTEVSQHHQNYLSGQLLSTSLYHHHAQNIYNQLTPEEIKRLAIQKYEYQMSMMDNLCCIENPEYILSSPLTKQHLQVIKYSLIASYNKADHKFTREKTLLKLLSQKNFVDALLSGKIDTFLQEVKHPDVYIAQKSFNELNQLWPYAHKGSFLNEKSYTSDEQKFIELIGMNVMRSAETHLISNPNYIVEHADPQSCQHIQHFHTKCISLQKQGNRKELHRHVQILKERVKKNDKKENFENNACFAIAIKSLTAPITKILDEIAHAPSLSSSQQKLDDFKKTIKNLAYEQNIFKKTKIKKLLIKECGFDPCQAAKECYIFYKELLARLENRTIYDPVEVIFQNIEQRELPAAHKEFLLPNGYKNKDKNTYVSGSFNFNKIFKFTPKL